MSPQEQTMSSAMEVEDGGVVKAWNYIDNNFVEPTTGEYMDVVCPSTNGVIGQVGISASADVEMAVASAKKAFESWSQLTIKARATVLLKFHALVRDNAMELAECIVKENGKNITEALADVAKGNETVEYACSMPLVAAGRTLQVSSNVECMDVRKPLGVVASIVPFNFPFMVPMWTLPIALVMGNTMILKPSEKVPLTMYKVTSLLQQAGVPPGVVNLLQGTKEVVNSIIDHPEITAVTFVGSSPVAKIVKERCNGLNKRCTALGGAKNHLVALEDCSVDTAANDIVVSFAGCAGQRCMAASVLLTFQENPTLIDKIVEIASKIQPGTQSKQMGPVIDIHSKNKILKYIADSESSGAKVLLDGRSWNNGENWIGPTVLLHSNKDDKALHEEIFGPVLSIYSVSSWKEAVEMENANPFGNAACIYTTNGGNSQWFLSRFRASMLGVNIGIPVPREPFSFGGLYGTRSKYGDMDITGDGAMEFFSNRFKITSKWPAPILDEPTTNIAPTDHANFAGRM